MPTPAMQRLLRQRVIVNVPDVPPRRYRGERRGEFQNSTGKWISVQVDGSVTLRWFWHEYVSADTSPAT